MDNEILVETEINAPAEKVWQILTDFASYPDWNPMIPKLDATLSVGAPVSFTLNANGLPLPVAGAEITNVELNRDFRWVGPSIEVLQTVVRMEHYFTIRPTDDKSCRFIHGEFATGVLGGPVMQLLKMIEGGYHDMNAALKARAER